MPSYNTDRFIAESIESVLQQTYTNWELIIVDDCSTDTTRTVLNNYIHDRRITVIINTDNQGAAYSRNLALKQARGRWIAFLDSDDIWFPEKLEKQIDFMENNGYHFSYTNYEEINENGQSRHRQLTGPKRITNVMMKQYCYPGCLTVMYDATYIGLVQIKDIKKNNDYAMWLKIASKANCYLLDETLAKYRRRSGSISNHSIFNLVQWHYKLWHDAVGYNSIKSLLYTGINLLFGTYKKIRFVDRK